jgi:hypothetical protein
VIGDRRRDDPGAQVFPLIAERVDAVIGQPFGEFRAVDFREQLPDRFP